MALPFNPTVADESQINGNTIQPTPRPRPIVSSLDTWDQETQIDYPFPAHQIGRRPAWNVPSLAVTSESVNTIQQNQRTRYVAPTVQVRIQQPVSPQSNAPIWKVVPNMAQNIYTDSHVQISFSINVSTGAVNDSPQFAIYRDGRKISQIFSTTTPAANRPVLVSGTYVDTKPSMRDTHVYDLRWRRGNSPVIAFGKDRTFQASNLRAQ